MASQESSGSSARARRPQRSWYLVATLVLAWSGSASAQTPAPTQDYVPGRVLVKFKGGVKAPQREAVLAETGAHALARIPQIDLQIVEVSPGTELDRVNVLRGHGAVEFAELDRRMPPAATDVCPNDPMYPNQGTLGQIGCPTAWSMTTGDSSIIIAILDTGVDGTHPDLAPNMVPGWNFYDNNANTSDPVGHGTWVAGTAAAVGNNGTGVASVAWGSKIMPIRISDPAGWGSYALIAQGLVWAADHGARVANVSYFLSPNSSVTAAAQYFQNHGGVVTTSAGNGGQHVNDPDNPYLVVVGAVAADDTLSAWSNTGPFVDMTAPERANTTGCGGTYCAATGTSISAPFVAGTAALVLSINPALSGQELQDALKQSADDLGAPGWDSSYGWGRLNANSAVHLSQSGGGGSPPPPPAGDTIAPTVQVTSPGDGAQVSGQVNIEASASDNVGVTRVEFYVDGTLRSTRTSTPFRYRWRTQQENQGAHTLTCKAFDAAGNPATSAAVTVYR